MIDFDSVKSNANGRWLGVFRALGMDVREDGRHSACPSCGGDDRFRMDDADGRGTYFCSQCGSGDGVSLVQKVLDVDFKGAMEAVAGVVGSCEKNLTPKEPSITPDKLRKIFVESKEISENCVAGSYLRGRGLSTFPKILRFHPNCYEPEKKNRVPAMLAVFSLPCGEAVTMHRTYLDGKGGKANIAKAKKLLPALKKMATGAIRLFDVEKVVAVAEGIETALAVKELMNVPCWSVVSNTLMETFEPPKGIETVIVCADNDKNFAGQKSAYILANRLSLKSINVSVMVPMLAGTDFLDELNREKERG